MNRTATISKLAINGGDPVIKEVLPSIKNASGRLIGNEELDQLKAVINSGTLAYIYGTKVAEFEKKFASLMGVNHAAAVSSGTAALHTALIYLNPEPGDEILVSPITDMGAVIPIILQQAIPVFVDIDPLTQNMDPSAIEQNISRRTRGILVTHIYGGPADMDPIMEIAKRHNLFVIEDCAQAHMTYYKNRLCGTLGHMGCFSFQQSKHITTGDGGMVISRDDNQFGRALRLCFDKGWPRNKPGRDHYFLAPNYHMTELQAAVGIAQLSKYQLSIERRQKAAAEMDRLLAGEDIIVPVETLKDSVNTYFHYCFRIRPECMSVKTDILVEALKAEGLPCTMGFPGPIPLYLYDMIRNKKTYGSSGWPFTSPAARQKWDYYRGLCPQAEKACLETVVLPWCEGLTTEHVRLMAEAIHKVIDCFKK